MVQSITKQRKCVEENQKIKFFITYKTNFMCTIFILKNRLIMKLYFNRYLHMDRNVRSSR